MNNLFGVSFDRIVFPLHSLMHIQIRLKRLLKNEILEITLRSKTKKILFYKKFDPIKLKNLDKKNGFLFEIDIPMKGSVWKIGQSYEIFAKYGNEIMSDSMTIAKRRPALQSDKSVYLVGSDIIVTVIAPDLDRDNDKPEYVGDKKSDSKLTISTKWGKLENYRLLETGDSTGIFQGIVGLIPAYKLKNGRKVKNRAYGKGPFNGYLPVSKGEIIDFKFKSDSGNARLIAYSSNFGASVELDQKIYTPTDKVYITIVAPDYNVNSNKIDSIGAFPNGKITISSSVGKLNNYKLVETGKDTGIFTGEIILTGHNSLKSLNRKQFGITKGNGPINGKLACTNNDKLRIVFDSGTEQYVAESLIQWNIGDISWDKSIYHENSKAELTVIDPDMNLNPNHIDSVLVRVRSDSDKQGISMILHETNEATGIFKGIVHLSNRKSSKHILHVENGDAIIATYSDKTLPKPYKFGDAMDISSVSKIGNLSTLPPLKRISVMDLSILNKTNKKIRITNLNDKLNITSTIINNQHNKQNFTVLLQIKDKQGITVHLSHMSSKLQAGKTFNPIFKWTPKELGKFDIELFVWESLDSLSALAEPISQSLIVH